MQCCCQAVVVMQTNAFQLCACCSAALLLLPLYTLLQAPRPSRCWYCTVGETHEIIWAKVQANTSGVNMICSHFSDRQARWTAVPQSLARCITTLNMLCNIALSVRTHDKSQHQVAFIKQTDALVSVAARSTVNAVAAMPHN